MMIMVIMKMIRITIKVTVTSDMRL